MHASNMHKAKKLTLCLIFCRLSTKMHYADKSKGKGNKSQIEK